MIVIVIVMVIIIIIMIMIIIIIVHLYSAHIHFLSDALYKTIPKNYNFTLRNLKTENKTSPFGFFGLFSFFLHRNWMPFWSDLITLKLNCRRTWKTKTAKSPSAKVKDL